MSNEENATMSNPQDENSRAVSLDGMLVQLGRLRNAAYGVRGISTALVKDAVDAEDVDGYRPFTRFTCGCLYGGLQAYADMMESELERLIDCLHSLGARNQLPDDY